jgi:hypothetical protein
MKIPFRADTATRLEAARQALTAAEAKITQLAADRAAAIADADDLSQISAIDLQLADEQRTAQACRDRLAALEARTVEEAATERVKAYETAVNGIARLLPQHDQAAADVEKAMQALSAAVRKYVQVGESILQQWPPIVPKPTYHLSTRPLGERLRSCFAMSSLVYSTTHAPPAATEYVRRACDAADRAAGFADAERTNRNELIAELRQRGALVAVIDDDEKEAAA